MVPAENVVPKREGLKGKEFINLFLFLDEVYMYVATEVLIIVVCVKNYCCKRLVLMNTKVSSLIKPKMYCIRHN